MEINRSQEAMATRSRRRKRRDAGLLLQIHEFANKLVKNGDEVQTINDVLHDYKDDGDLSDFDGRIALLETSSGATENVFESKYHSIAQVMSHEHDKKTGHSWQTQAWQKNGDKQKNGLFANSPEDIFLLPPDKSEITLGKGKNKRRYHIDYNLNTGQVKLDPVVDNNSNSQRAKRSKTNPNANAKTNDDKSKNKSVTARTPNKKPKSKSANRTNTPDNKTPKVNAKTPKRKTKSQANSKSNRKQTTPQSNSKSNRKQTTPQSNSKSNRTPKPKAPVGSAVKNKKRLSSARRRAARNKHEAHADTALDDTPKSKGKKRYVYDHRMRDSYMTITCLTHICNSYV